MISGILPNIYITKTIISISCGNIHEIILHFFPNYIIINDVKRIYPSKILFYITPYLIIYTPLETPGSSPTGCFPLLPEHTGISVRWTFISVKKFISVTNYNKFFISTMLYYEKHFLRTFLFNIPLFFQP